MAYGYILNATILQVAQGYAMLANHGMEMPLSLRKIRSGTPRQAST